MHRLFLKAPSSARERAFFRLAKTAKQAILLVSSMEPDAVRRKISRSKPDRVFRQSLVPIIGILDSVPERENVDILLVVFRERP